MVGGKVNIRDKHRNLKKVLKVFIMVFAIVLVLLTAFLAGFFTNGKIEIVLENPLKDIVFANTNEKGEVDFAAVLAQGVLEFDEDYINYILVALGVGYLHKSLLFENPLIEFVLGEEVWSSEIIKGMPNSKKGEIDNEDLRIIISKQEAVRALLSSDIEQFMKDSVAEGRTGIEMVAGKAELFSKGYFKMYGELSGEGG